MTTQLPIAIIGAGPVGLAAAAHLVERDLPFVLLESGNCIGTNALAWGHVQMFSPWRYNMDRAAIRLLEQTGWQAPDLDAFPTGRALVEQYLAPLAAHSAIAPHLRLGARVVAVARAGLDKMKNAGRDQAPFALYIAGEGGEDLLHAAAVIDASGTYQTPNPLGACGIPAPGERALADKIVYGIPDVLGAARERYAGRRVLVAGSGHSAFNVVLDLATLAEEVPGTTITWVVRRAAMGQAYGGGTNDALPARGALGSRVQALVERGIIRLITNWHTDRLSTTADGIAVAAGEQTLTPVDELIVATGLRPDLAMLGELRLGLDPAVEAPTALAPLIDPNYHSCGTVRPHGVDELAHPEPGLYIIGMKSYGRAPTFLLATGYEQARSVAAALAGDWEAARRVELELPETGVCSTPTADGGAACCDGRTTAPAAFASLIEIDHTPTTRQTVPVAFTSLIDLTPAVAAVDATTSCCAPAVQATCCAPEGKGACCGTSVDASAGTACGCQ
ncbi:MAG TPA: NAD(P)-binding domain-containing protein [Roseiflexaceae bacterium]|nr:NAD(P)-binding domain-containing protein [Roseiflexaceae bacterium]